MCNKEIFITLLDNKVPFIKVPLLWIFENDLSCSV